MKSIAMTVEDASFFGAAFTGPKDGIYYEDGKLYVPDDLYEAAREVSLQGVPDQSRLDACAAVDAAAEKARMRYLTPGLGQAMTYQAKLEEVRRYDQDTNPVKAGYPFLTAEIGVTAPSLIAVVEAVRKSSTTWFEKGPEIERVRLKAKADIAKADSLAKIAGIVNELEWP